MRTWLITTFVVLLMTASAWQHWSHRQTLAAIEHQLQLMAAPTLQRVDTTEQSRHVHEEQLQHTIAQMNQAIGHLQTQLQAALQSSEVGDKPADGAHMSLSQPSAQHQQDARQFSDRVESILALGVLDDNAWRELDQDLSAMSYEENRAFWIQVFSGIESGELHLVSAEN